MNVATLQQSLLTLGYELPKYGVDGDLGDETLAAYRGACYDYEASSGVSLDDDIEDDEVTDAMFAFLVEQAKLSTSQTSITTVAAWAGRPSIIHPDHSVAFCLEHGINRLVIICDDHSIQRSPTTYQLRPEGADAIVRLARLCHDAGIAVSLMWWTMPHEVYLRSAADILLPLAHLCRADRIEADAEEPHTKARKRMPYDEAADLFADLFRPEIATGAAQAPRVELGVNGIGYTPVKAFGPLSSVCEYTTCQGYMTSTQPIKGAPARFAKRWRQVFPDIKDLKMGLAAYRQSGIKTKDGTRFSPTTAMRHSLESALEAGVSEVCYWWLQSIMRNAEVARVVKGILA
jgi:hypothetical protein